MSYESSICQIQSQLRAKRLPSPPEGEGLGERGKVERGAKLTPTRKLPLSLTLSRRGERGQNRPQPCFSKTPFDPRAKILLRANGLRTSSCRISKGRCAQVGAHYANNSICSQANSNAG